MNVKVKLSGDKQITAFIKSLVPRGMKIAAMRAIGVWYAGREGEGLRKEPPTKFASRANAYGNTGATFENGAPVPPGYFSAKQFRYVAAITKGFTQRYTRTHELSNAWQYSETNSQWDRVNFTNSAPGAQWVYTDGAQARQLNNVGWRGALEIVSASYKGAIKYAQAKVNELIRRKGR